MRHIWLAAGILLNPLTVQAKCEIWDFNQIPREAFTAALQETSDPKKGEVDDWMKYGPEWVKRLPLFTEQEKNELSTKQVGFDLHTAFLVNAGSKQFFLKRTTCDEAERSFRISQTALVDLQCVRERVEKSELSKSFKTKSNDDVPHFVKTLAVHRINRSYCDELIEMAPGVEAYKVPTSDKSALRKIGQQLAFLHALGFIHGDSSRENIFYDPKTQVVTFIDYSTLQLRKDLASRLADLVLLEVNGPDAPSFDPLISLRQKFQHGFAEQGKARVPPLAFIAAIKKEPLEEPFAGLARLESRFFSFREIVTGYLEASPLESRAFFTKSIPKDRGLDLEGTYQDLNALLKKEGGLNAEQIQVFWTRFPSLRQIINGEYDLKGN